MGEEKIERIARLIDQFVAQPPDPGTRVDNDNVIALGSDFKAGGVAAIFVILFA